MARDLPRLEFGMRDPLVEAHLWFLLVNEHKSMVTLDEVCWFHGERALRAVQAAWLKPCDWINNVFKELHYVDARGYDAACPRWVDYEPTEATAQAEELAAPPHRIGAGSIGEDPWAEPTPTEPQRVAG